MVCIACKYCSILIHAIRRCANASFPISLSHTRFCELIPSNIVALAHLERKNVCAAVCLLNGNGFVKYQMQEFFARFDATAPGKDYETGGTGQSYCVTEPSPLVFLHLAPSFTGRP